MNYGTAPLTRVTLSDNHAEGGGEGFGGAIDNRGTLTLQRTTISGNYANQDGTANLTNVTLCSNSAGSLGGGIRNASGTTLNLKNVIVNNGKSEAIAPFSSRRLKH
jgi:hypothetical protein